MSPGTVFIVIIAVIIAIGRALKGAQGDAQRRRVRVTDDEGYEAAPEEIQEFLRSLNTAAQRKAAGVQTTAPQMGQTAPVPGGTTQPSFWEGGPAVQPVPVAQAAPQQRPTRARKRQTPRRKGPPREAIAAQPPVAAPAAPKPTGSGKTPVLPLRGADLKRAVVWSEVLGPPVSLRRTRRLPLGPQQ